MSDTGARADWATKDFYAELGVDTEGHPGRDQEGLPQARARQPPRLQPGRHRQAREVQGRRRGLRRRRRRGEAQEVRRDPQPLRRRRVPRRLPAAGPRRRRSGSTSATCCATGRGGFGDMFGDIFGGRGGAADAHSRPVRSGAPTSRAARRSSFTDALDGVTISLRLTSDAACPDCHGTGGKPGHPAARSARSARAPGSS